MRALDAVRGRPIGAFGVAATVLLVLIGAALGYAVIHGHPGLFVDESAHVAQVSMLAGGNAEIHPGITMFPTYHAALALVERIAGQRDIALLRFANLLGGLLLPVLVWKLVAMHSPKESGRRTLQWFYMPLVFPFFFFVYTDIWALVAVLATQLAALSGRYVLAAIAGLAATLLRQDMIVWVGMAWLLVVLEELGFGEERAAWRQGLRDGFLRGIPLLLVMIAFTAFYLWNHGVAVGDRSMHETGFNPTNIAYFLLCAWLVFLPQNVRALPRIRRLLHRPSAIAWLLAGFALYMGTYANTHVYNSEHLRFHLHNEGLYWLTAHTGIRALAYIPIAWMVLTACVTDLAAPRLRVLYFVAPISVGLHPLIEQRYYLPALTLFQVWRPTTGGRFENAMLAGYGALTGLMMWGIATGRFFP